jgi:mannose-1-phosphate guanylyltransferase
MSDNYYALIMAGGGGTRLWPLSRQGKPKQMLKLFGDRTLFQISVDRLRALFPLERILVVTSGELADDFKRQCPELPNENYILEPWPCDTAAAIGLAAIILQQRDPEAIMTVVTADHFIEYEQRFLNVLRAAHQVAEKGYLVTLGIHPSYPSTAFGYIQQGNYLGTYENIVVFHALNFKEKPDQTMAEKFIENEDHSWNSGMFIWQVESILGEIKQQLPKLHIGLDKIRSAIGTKEYPGVLQKVWGSLDKVSVDVGIMEQAERVAVIPARGLGWNDVGSWDTLFDVLEPDESGNIIICDQYINLDGKGTLVHQNNGLERLIVTLGVKDLVIVDTGDVLMVCTKEQAQNVKEIVNILKEKGKEKYL